MKRIIEFGISGILIFICGLALSGCVSGNYTIDKLLYVHVDEGKCIKGSGKNLTFERRIRIIRTNNNITVQDFSILANTTIR